MGHHQLVLLTGCSGGGKSTLLAELAARGHRVVEEPGRRIVAEELASGGSALPWIDMVAFARRALEMARQDHTAAADLEGWTFFDRGLVDAAVGLEHLTGTPAVESLASDRYHQRVFMAPPWPGIYRTDSERRHGMDEAVAEYERLLVACPALGYEVIHLPRVSVTERADFVLASLAAATR
ncbi:AAA family ATPase [Rubellimicrobium roseum]|uniref:ATPase n=1 Tax=Rubellimicrobium roseum TaxID=687525 RepID=A0A5C4NCH6_9RHOB|nr:AAA family ATPase [Rubellimicrobium roseum]TNC64918.1 ATPase [Rubellimicrobium roseum]